MVEKIKKNLPLLALVFGIFAVLMVFCPWVADEDGLAAISGLNLIFGNEDYELAFSFFGLITFGCLVAGVVLTYLADSKNDGKLKLIAGICFAAGVLCLALSVVFLSFDMSEMKESLEKMGMSKKEIREQIAEYVEEAKEDLVLGAGAWIGMICSAVAAGCTLIPALQDKSVFAKPAAAPVAAAPAAAPAAEAAPAAAPAEVAQASEPTDAE